MGKIMKDKESKDMGIERKEGLEVDQDQKELDKLNKKNREESRTTNNLTGGNGAEYID